MSGIGLSVLRLLAEKENELMCAQVLNGEGPTFNPYPFEKAHIKNQKTSATQSEVTTKLDLGILNHWGGGDHISDVQVQGLVRDIHQDIEKMRNCWHNEKLRNC